MPSSPISKVDSAPFRGVFPVFQLPFHDDEAIDWQTLANEIEWLVQNGVEGVSMAMVSEILRLSSEERDSVVEFVVKQVDRRCRVIVSVGAESSHTAKRHASFAEATGCDAVMAIPPISIPIEDDERRAYFDGILNTVSIPLIVQDASGYVGRPMSISFQQRLLDEFGPQRVLFKPEAQPIGPRLTELIQATGGQAVIFEGSGGLHLLDSFSRGISATMPGAEISDAIQLLWKALCADDLETIQRIDPLIRGLVELQNTLDEFLAIEKHILHRRGIFPSARVRGPVGFRLPNETKVVVDEKLDELLIAMEDCN